MQPTLFNNITLPAPVNIGTELLKALIERNSISERDFVYNSFRIRLTEIRRALLEKGIIIQFHLKEFTNKYNRKNFYREHYLLEIDKEKAIEVFNELNK